MRLRPLFLVVLAHVATPFSAVAAEDRLKHFTQSGVDAVVAPAVVETDAIGASPADVASDEGVVADVPLGFRVRVRV